MNALETRIAQLIIDTLNLEDITAAEIPPERALFGDGLGLDSVDALELALALQNTFGVRMEADVKDARQHFLTVGAMALFVQSQQASCTA
jgi:acyl carrier protein